MNFFKKIFSLNKDKQNRENTQKQKPSFLTWLCSSKSSHSQIDDYQNKNYNSIPLQSSTNKSTIHQSNTTKITQRLSFQDHPNKQYFEEQLNTKLITINEEVVEGIEHFIYPNELYGIVNEKQPLTEKGIWLKIGRAQQINSLCHIKPYFFNQIFLLMDQFGMEFSILEILLSRQNILLKLDENSSIQSIIQVYEKQLMEHFGFKPLCECFSKLKLTVYRTKINQNIWIQFNDLNSVQSYVQDILEQVGFEQSNDQYLKLKSEIPNLLTLQEYMEFIDHKSKLMSKYEGQNVDQYIKNKFLQKINSKSHTPRNTDSPRTIQKNNSNQQNQQNRSQSSGYNEYILSITANTLPKDEVNQVRPTNNVNTKFPEKNSYEEQIFQFNIYKEDKEQDAKRVAISKQRKKRSRSEDITVGDLHNYEDMEDQSDYFEKRE